MRSLNPSRLLLILASLVAPACALTQDNVPIPETPAAVRDVLYVRPFSLDTGFLFTWVPERPTIDNGVIVVLSVDPRLVFPRNAPEPVLYAGDRVVERLNWGYESGNVIAIVPGDFDVTSEPVWFGSPALPGRVAKDRVRSERASVERSYDAMSSERAAGVTEPAVHARDLDELLRGELAELVLRYAPQESHLARKWRLPEARAGDDPAVPVNEQNGGELK